MVIVLLVFLHFACNRYSVVNDARVVLVLVQEFNHITKSIKAASEKYSRGSSGLSRYLQLVILQEGNLRDLIVSQLCFCSYNYED
ncbi:hypothetical protein Godav_027876, partial [Gossypium davidsonii]|nr:hypothetical protein [Gossypium davidsonii]